MTKEDIEQFKEIMNEVIEEKLKPIKSDIAEIKKDIGVMKTDIEEIKIEAKITREVTNEIGKWVELNATPNNPYPTDKTAV